MHRTIVSVVLLIGLLLLVCSAASARNFSGETGNKATFETLEEAPQNAPAVVKTYQGGNTMPPPGTPGFGAPGAGGPGGLSAACIIAMIGNRQHKYLV